MSAHPLNLACRPSADEIIERNRSRDWLDAHCDYAATGDAHFRQERDSYEEAPAQTEGRGALSYLLAALGTAAVLQWGIPLMFAGIKIIGGAL